MNNVFQMKPAEAEKFSIRTSRKRLNRRRKKRGGDGTIDEERKKKRVHRCRLSVPSFFLKKSTE